MVESKYIPKKFIIYDNKGEHVLSQNGMLRHTNNMNKRMDRSDFFDSHANSVSAKD